jgi:hypothetical protein
MYANIRVLQIEAQMLGERLHSRFARVVRYVSRRIRDALFTSRDDNRRRLVWGPRLETRDVGVEAVDDALEIGVEDLYCYQ